VRTRDKILYCWLGLAVVAAIFGGGFSRGIVNILFSVAVNVVCWFLILKLVFWIYDKIKKGKKANET